MIVTVVVTDQDLKNGWEWAGQRMMKKYGKMFPSVEHKRCFHCPVAIALARTFGEKAIAETYRLHIGNIQYRTPEIVSDWMSDFDNLKDVQPFSFNIETEHDRLPQSLR